MCFEIEPLICEQRHDTFVSSRAIIDHQTYVSHMCTCLTVSHYTINYYIRIATKVSKLTEDGALTLNVCTQNSVRVNFYKLYHAILALP